MKPKTVLNAIALTAGFVLAWPQAQAAPTTYTRELVAFNNQGDLKIHLIVVRCEDVNGEPVCAEINVPVTDPVVTEGIKGLFDTVDTQSTPALTRAAVKAAEESRRAVETKIFAPEPVVEP